MSYLQGSEDGGGGAMTAAGTGGTGGIEGWMKPGLNADLEMKGGSGQIEERVICSSREV